LYKNLVALLAKRLLVVLFIYQLCRLIFYVFNRESFTNFDLGVILGGLQFDLSAIGYINLVFILAHLIPGQFKYKPAYQKGLKIGFFVVNLVFIATNFVDFEYYKFTGRRSSFGLITASGMENEIGGLLLSFITEFWYLPLLLILFGFGFWKFLGNFKKGASSNSSRQLLKESLILLFALAIGLVAGRGGFGKKPIRIVDAVSYSGTGNAALILNTPFAILKTIGKKETLENPKFYDDETLEAIFNPIYETKPAAALNKKNVVIIILESFGDENIGIGFTPFLDSLIQKSYYFKNGFANGKLSIDAVPSSLSSIPSLMNNSLITSSYSLNEIFGLPKILKDNGYTTSFFHGAFNGSQNFDQYCKVAGFDAYYGKNEYDGPSSFDGKWGVFDEDFLQYFNTKLSGFQEPFFASIFTISSHNPYTVPEKYKGKFPKGKTKILESIAYTDYALKQFFESAKKEDWYKNTLFIFTADHTSSEPTLAKHKTNVGKFRIPIVFFDPSNSDLKGISDKNFQQIDIMPSVIDYLQIKTKMVTYGKSFQSDKNFVVYFLDNVYHYIDGDYYLAFDGKKAIGLYNFKTDELLKNNLLKTNSEKAKEMEKFIKAYVQSFNMRVIENKLTVEKE
jgi:phosphoglycerol transferase MdoB-like AlkP superfamily enzyme